MRPCSHRAPALPQLHSLWDSPCDVLFSCSCMPAGLTVQQKKIKHGQHAKVSPQWQMATTPDTYPAQELTAVGFEKNGNPLWLSLGLDHALSSWQVRPALVPIIQGQPVAGSDWSTKCMATKAWSALYSGVLVNAEGFIWVARLEEW